MEFAYALFMTEHLTRAYSAFLATTRSLSAVLYGTGVTQNPFKITCCSSTAAKSSFQIAGTRPHIFWNAMHNSLSLSVTKATMLIEALWRAHCAGRHGLRRDIRSASPRQTLL